jgi:ribosomal-protein-serine acetyltransferase
MHAAGAPGFLTAGLLREAGRVMFDVLQVQRVTIRCRASNLALQAAAERCGFKREGLMRRFFGDEDAAILGLLSTEYRFNVQRKETQDRRAA